MADAAFGALLAEIDRAGVEHLLVGGLAVGAHGYVRATADVDILVAPATENVRRLRELLLRLGAVRPDGSELPADAPDGKRFLRVRTALGVLDVLPEGEPPLDFTSMSARAITAEIEGVAVAVVDLATLVTLKMIADRPEDRQDLQKLRTAHGWLPDPLIDIADLRSSQSARNEPAGL